MLSSSVVPALLATSGGWQGWFGGTSLASGRGQLGQWLFPSRLQTEALLPGQQPWFGVYPSIELLEGAVIE